METILRVKAAELEAGDILEVGENRVWGQYDPDHLAPTGDPDGFSFLRAGRYTVLSVEEAAAWGPITARKRCRLELDGNVGKHGFIVQRTEPLPCTTRRPALPIILVATNTEVVLAAWTNATPPHGPYRPLFEAAKDAGLAGLREHLRLATPTGLQVHVSCHPTYTDSKFVVQLTGEVDMHWGLVAEAHLDVDNRGTRPRWTFSMEVDNDTLTLTTILIKLGFKEA